MTAATKTLTVLAALVTTAPTLATCHAATTSRDASSVSPIGRVGRSVSTPEEATREAGTGA